VAATTSKYIPSSIAIIRSLIQSSSLNTNATLMGSPLHEKRSAISGQQEYQGECDAH
jgi:hypothetical protein